MAFVEKVFSGVQPTGNLHLGNYLGAIVNFVKMQQTHDCIYCVVDMHAITQGVDVWGGPAELARNTREVTAAFIASGIDPKKHIVFNQSQVSGHAEDDQRAGIWYPGKAPILRIPKRVRSHDDFSAPRSCLMPAARSVR